MWSKRFCSFIAIDNLIYSATIQNLKNLRLQLSPLFSPFFHFSYCTRCTETHWPTFLFKAYGIGTLQFPFSFQYIFNYSNRVSHKASFVFQIKHEFRPSHIITPSAFFLLHCNFHISFWISSTNDWIFYRIWSLLALSLNQWFCWWLVLIRLILLSLCKKLMLTNLRCYSWI